MLSCLNYKVPEAVWKSAGLRSTVATSEQQQKDLKVTAKDFGSTHPVPQPAFLNITVIRLFCLLTSSEGGHWGRPHRGAPHRPPLSDVLILATQKPVQRVSWQSVSDMKLFQIVLCQYIPNNAQKKNNCTNFKCKTWGSKLMIMLHEHSLGSSIKLLETRGW